MLSVKQGSCEYNFEVIGLTQLRIKPKSTAPEADALTTRPPEHLSKLHKNKYSKTSTECNILTKLSEVVQQSVKLVL